MNKLTHIDNNGKANMVDVGTKNSTFRTAEAVARIKVSPTLFNMIKNNELKKGDVLSTAKIAGIQGGKKTSDLIPLCHNIFISKLDVELKLIDEYNTIEIISYAKTEGQTGIEMEALTAVSIAALTVYDMCKAVDKSIIINEIKLVKKTGGKSGDFHREENKVEK